MHPMHYMSPIQLLAFVLTMTAATATRAQDGASHGAPHGPPPTPVRVAAVVEESLAPRKKVFGELRPARFAVIASEEPGIIREVLVREGKIVERGAILARIDDMRLKIEIAVNAGNEKSGKAMVAERSASLGLAKRQFELLRQASDGGGANPRELLDAESAVEVAQSQLTQATSALEVIAGAGELLARRGEDLEIRAPFGGVVTKKYTEVGAWVGEGDPIVDLAETQVLEAWFDVPQELYEATQLEVARLSQDSTTPTVIEVTAGAGQRIAGSSLRVIPSIDLRSRTFHAVLEVPNADARLAAGLALTAFVPQGPARMWKVIPKDALIYQGASPFVFLVDKGIAQPIPVAPAFPVGDRVAIEASSLAVGALVVIEGNERLMPMSPVAPMGESAAGAMPSSSTAPKESPQ